MNYETVSRDLKEQQTSDDLIVKDPFFITEIFDKFSFSGILRGCLRPGLHDIGLLFMPDHLL